MRKNIHNRLELAGLKGRFKKSGIFSLFQPYSEEFPLLDITIHGLTLICGRKIRKGDKLVLRLQTPQGLSVDLHSEVVDLNPEGGGKFRLANIKFMPFDEDIMGNSYQSLMLLQNILTLLDIPYS